MDDQAEYKYDVFISYSHADRDWVWNELLPRLEQAELKIIIDERDFEIGVPSIINMERAVDNSRHTLVVLTPAWLKSEWTEFESLLVGTADPAGRRRKLIPLMLKPCELPPRIAMLTYADFTDPSQRDAQMTRLLKSIGSLGSSVPVPFPEEKLRDHTSRKLGIAMVAVIAVIVCVRLLIPVAGGSETFVDRLLFAIGLDQPTPSLTIRSTEFSYATPTKKPTGTPTFTLLPIATNTPAPIRTPTLMVTITPRPINTPTAPSQAGGMPTMEEITIFADKDSLTIYMPANVNLSLNAFNLEYSMNGQEERYFFADSEGFAPYVDGAVAPPVCLRLERAGSSVPFPLECQAVNRPIVRLPGGSVFWWDEFGQNTKTLFVNLGEEPLDVCATGFSRCSIEIP